MTSKIIDVIQGELVEEALASPQLLADVAKLEGYISETYSDRSFVELLQNADDAGAMQFHVRLMKDCVICSNDGRPFTDADLRSICRSGASTKTRGQTIGYRGIGFKSVAALAERVHILSGDIGAIFDRDLTSRLTGLSRASVPLIRIPHHAKPEVVWTNSSVGMTTVFVFEGVDIQRALRDLHAVDDNCLLFLRNVENITLDILGQEQSFRCSRKSRGDNHLLDVHTSGETRQWEVRRGHGVDFAFSKHGGHRVPLRKEQALVHAFLPTSEVTGLGIRINGDFSTDPSRTRVVLDERTLGLIDESSTMILEVINSALSVDSEADILSCLALNIDVATVAFIKPCFGTELMKSLRTRANGVFDHLVLRPAWLNETDFRQIAASAGLKVLPKQITGEADEALHQTMKALGVKPADESQLINGLVPDCLSDKGRKEVVDYARKLLMLSAPKAEKLLALQGFAVDDAGKTLTLGEAISLEDQARSANENRSLPRPMAQVDEILLPPSSHEARSENTVSISRWRQGENAVAEIFRSQGYEVEDHSRQNLGYDLLARNKDGIYFIEVKTISSGGEPFVMTTNEEVVARQKGDWYLIALQRELEDCVELAILRNPANTLQLDRQCRQWVWECSTYDYRPRKFSTKT